jgi:hypothetical protein
MDLKIKYKLVLEGVEDLTDDFYEDILQVVLENIVDECMLATGDRKKLVHCLEGDITIQEITMDQFKNSVKC